MNLPKDGDFIRIGPFEYEVIYTSETHNEGEDLHLGNIDHVAHRVSIEKTGISEQMQQLAFLHEMLHGFHFVNRLNEKFESNQHPTEEEIIWADSISLYQFIKDNQELFKL